MKVNVLLEHADYMSSFDYISKANRHDRTIAGLLNLTLGSIVAFDRANTPFALFGLWTTAGLFFVSSMKDNAIYKDRWEIEVFFKSLKQHLKVKTFIGKTENVLPIQIWTVLIALLLLKYLHQLSKLKWSLSNLATMLRLNLFTYRDLAEWVNDSFGNPPLTTGSYTQLSLPGTG